MNTIPVIEGTWRGPVYFGDTATSCVLTLVIRQNDAGKLSGMLSSGPPLDQFSLPVRGEISEDSECLVQSEDDGTTLIFSGAFANNCLMGTVHLGEGTGMSPRKGGEVRLYKALPSD